MNPNGHARGPININRDVLPPQEPLAIEKRRNQLSALDRCDVGNCGARAYHRLTTRSGVLYFCHHHGKQTREAIEVGTGKLPTAKWLDESSQLEESERVRNHPTESGH